MSTESFCTWVGWPFLFWQRKFYTVAICLSIFLLLFYVGIFVHKIFSNPMCNCVNNSVVASATQDFLLKIGHAATPQSASLTTRMTSIFSLSQWFDISKMWLIHQKYSNKSWHRKRPEECRLNSWNDHFWLKNNS